MRRSLVLLLTVLCAVATLDAQRTRARRIRAHPLAAQATDPAAQWFVNASTGNNANACTTSGSPCLTLAGVMAKAIQPGDIVEIADGTYTVNGLVWTKSGTAGNPITVRGNGTGGCAQSVDSDPLSRGFRPNPGVTLSGVQLGPEGDAYNIQVQANYVTFKCLRLPVGGYYVSASQHDLEFDDIYMDGQGDVNSGGASIVIGNQQVMTSTADAISNVLIQRNYSTLHAGCVQTLQANNLTMLDSECNNMNQGETDHIHPFGDTQLYRNNYLHGNVYADRPTSHSDGFQVFGCATPCTTSIFYSKNITIDRNTIMHHDEGIITSNETSAYPSGMSNWTVTNNLIALHRIGDTNDYGGGFGETTNVLFYHNTIIDQTWGCGRGDGARPTDVTAKNNIFSGTFGTQADCTLTSSNNQTQASSTFVNSAGSDWHLTNGSTGVGAGATGLGVTTDRDNCTRRSPPTIGAFEFPSVSCS